MSSRATAAIVVGVSYVELFESGEMEPEDIEKVATKLGLETYTEMPVFDTPSDVLVGVIFNERPTDAQVAEAEAKVKAALPALTEKLGEASSAVETWLVASID